MHSARLGSGDVIYIVMLIAAIAALTIQYGFEANTRYEYDMKFHFDGFLPILGGNEGKVDIDLVLDVRGRDASASLRRTQHEIKNFNLSFNRVPLPLGLDAAQDIFPLTRIGLEPSGRVVENDAPDRDLPVRLPGLHVKRFAEISYVPIEFPMGALSEGQTWSFSRDFGESPVNYTCTLQKLGNDSATIAIRLNQKYSYYENDLLEAVSNRSDAVAEVEVTMTGTGTVEFDLARGVPLKVAMRNSSTSVVKPFRGGNSQRKLDFRVDLVRKATPGVPAAASGSSGQSGSQTASQNRTLWGRISDTARRGWSAVTSSVAAARMFASLLLRSIGIPVRL